jgi:branched-chain amino acid transport system ATP-binding protein
MLEARGLGVSYGATRAVDAFDLQVDSAEAVALLGANGAGKTSTLRALSRLLDADGVITFQGDDVGRIPPEELARRGLIHVPEGRHVFSNLTVDENLGVGETSRGKRRALFTKDSVYDLFTPLTALRKRYGWSLSGGEQQMVAIGRALMASPFLLMLDEPSLGLAPIVTKAVYRALAEVKSEMSMLVVEQNAGVALQLCDRGYVLMSGRCVMSDTAAQLGDRQTLLDSYLGHGVEDDTGPDGADAQDVGSGPGRTRPVGGSA